MSWKDAYFDRRLLPTIHRERQHAALRWVRQLRLPVPSQILEIDCGMGLISCRLAKKGHQVQAIDRDPAMVRSAQQQAARWHVRNVQIARGDVRALPFADRSFDLVIGVGALSGSRSESAVLEEMRRVLCDGGYLLLGADNSARLDRILDPVSRLLYRFKHWRSGGDAATKCHRPVEIDGLVERVGLRKMKSTSVGFGPFTILGQPVFGEWIGGYVHRGLQRLADSNKLPLAPLGAHYLVLAEKPANSAVCIVRHERSCVAATSR